MPMGRLQTGFSLLSIVQGEYYVPVLQTEVIVRLALTVGPGVSDTEFLSENPGF